jgi:hypothetical protein
VWWAALLKHKVESSTQGDPSFMYCSHFMYNVTLDYILEWQISTIFINIVHSNIVIHLDYADSSIPVDFGRNTDDSTMVSLGPHLD